MKLKTDVGHMAKETGNEQSVCRRCSYPSMREVLLLKHFPNLLLLQGLLASIVARESSTNCCKVWLGSCYNISHVFSLWESVFSGEATGCRDRWEAERAKLIAVLRLLAGEVASGFRFIRIHNLDCLRLTQRANRLAIQSKVSNSLRLHHRATVLPM